MGKAASRRARLGEGTAAGAEPTRAAPPRLLWRERRPHPCPSLVRRPLRNSHHHDESAAYYKRIVSGLRIARGDRVIRITVMMTAVCFCRDLLSGEGFRRPPRANPNKRFPARRNLSRAILPAIWSEELLP